MSPSKEALRALQSAFDRAFEAPWSAEREATEPFLSLRAGAQPYALRLSELAAVHPMRRLLRLPGGPVGCLGLAGLRGKMVPVFDLAAVLGASAASPPGWLVVTQGEPPVAWAFDALDRLVHVPADAVRPAAGSVAGLTHTVAIDGVAHAVLNLPTLVATLVPRADAPGPSKEFSS